MWNRRGFEKSKQFPELVKDLQRNKHTFVIDGEVVYVVKGKDIFNILQRRSSTTNPQKRAELIKEYPVKFIGFDVVNIDGYDITNLPQKERDKILSILLRDKDRLYPIRNLPNTEKTFHRACESGWEGLIVKDKTAPYQPGVRSPAWQKEKCWEEDTAYVIGVTKGKGKRKDTFGALLLAKKTRDGRYRYVGRASGFTEAQYNFWNKKLSEVRVKKKPGLINPHKLKGDVKFWVNPREYEADIRYGQVTKDGIYRFPNIIRVKEVS